MINVENLLVTWAQTRRGGRLLFSPLKKLSKQGWKHAFKPKNKFGNHSEPKDGHNIFTDVSQDDSDTGDTSLTLSKKKKRSDYSSSSESEAGVSVMVTETTINTEEKL